MQPRHRQSAVIHPYLPDGHPYLPAIPRPPREMAPPPPAPIAGTHTTRDNHTWLPVFKCSSVSCSSSPYSNRVGINAHYLHTHGVLPCTKSIYSFVDRHRVTRVCEQSEKGGYKYVVSMEKPVVKDIMHRAIVNLACGCSLKVELSEEESIEKIAREERGHEWVINRFREEESALLTCYKQ
ncbi:Protein of unknown function [Pyronema omphalodes CBS 100304]|uniref:Uncharacterized protein n=1 Tax=Pyronema omphalodes (strain CBS 100304) TaxID=1076935 RepID=U4L1F9_PYROM|nr:Protein of unknown function [Pyronema omphalodes CBS 100304]